MRIGTAGWTIPQPHKPAEPGTHLHHYSRALNCVEINSSFYRPHRAATWQKWAEETPNDFRFAVKAPKTITHEAKLIDIEEPLKSFLDQVQNLKEKLGPVLFQLPPSLPFKHSLAQNFFTTLRAHSTHKIVLEPRHTSWFTEEAEALLIHHQIARAAADPPKGSPLAAHPGGDTRLTYYRLHGSPRIYYSNYAEDFLHTLATKLQKTKNTWVIFDNTALGHAYPNALTLRELLLPS
jgi:uncharacterized protein YecE (DUF72 family)